MASPQLVGVPFGRRFMYGMHEQRANPVARKNENRNATFMPGHFSGFVSNAISNSAALPVNCCTNCSHATRGQYQFVRENDR